MKSIKIILASLIILFSVNVQAQTVVEVIDFHSTRRCKTCNNIEANTIYTLDTYFAKEMKEGTVTFQIVNIDEDENYKMAEKFEASGTALFLNVKVNGKEKAYNLTTFAFRNGNNKESFTMDLKAKIEVALKSK